MNTILPYSPKFQDLLSGYCGQLQGVAKQGGHHDQRRALLLNFPRNALGIENAKVEQERSSKAAEVCGRPKRQGWRRHAG